MCVCVCYSQLNSSQAFVNFLFQARGIPKLTVYTWTFIRLGKPRPRLPTQHNAVTKYRGIKQLYTILFSEVDFVTVLLWSC